MRVIVMISGNGSNLQAIIDATQNGHLKHVEIVLVVSNRKAAYGLQRAEAAGIPTLYSPLKPYKQAGKTREDYDRDLAQKLATYSPDLIVLAGWMHILSKPFIDVFPQKVINLHPALPAQYPGINAIERAFDDYKAGEITHSGVMMHYVIPEVDAGDVILHAEVPMLPDDTLEDFAKRMHAAEHQIIVKAIALIAAKPT